MSRRTVRITALVSIVMAMSTQSAAQARDGRHDESKREAWQKNDRLTNVTVLHDPFTKRLSDQEDEWMLVLTPAAAATQTKQAAEAAQVFSSRNEDWKAPELRIGVEEFKRQSAAGNVLVLDVRDSESYRQGHLPGALLMTPEELSTDAGVAQLRDERRLIVAYCS